jgi:glutathione synthase/RimK-type ligase-like ATP-grasp enzyme
MLLWILNINFPSQEGNIFKNGETMKKILIPTMPDDQHAIFVKMALRTKGHEGILWYTADFPGLQTHSFELKERKIHWQSKGPDFNVTNNEFDVVWWRRPRQPVLPDYVHDEDIENANHENLELFKTFWNVVAPTAFWVNPVVAARQASCKLLQLKIASESGLAIPDTLISNDPQKIKNFILRNGITNSIYKPLYPVAWLGKDDMRLTYTREINLSMLPNDNMLQSTAGIFQRKILKAYELRVNILGDCCIAVKINSQEHPKGKMDWRYVPGHELKVEAYNLPAEVLEKCKIFMKKQGVVFGCFDFIVTPDGEYYFLEINEQGQFLWIEDVNPDIKMLDAFTDFLIAGANDFNWQQSSTSVSLMNYYDGMSLLKEHAIKHHQAPLTLF